MDMMPASAPMIVTDRLILRAHQRSDYEDCLALWSHPHTIRFIGGVPHSAQDAWFRLLRYGGMWAMQGYGFWAMEDRETGAFVGDAGLMDAMRGLPGLDGVPEAGWALVEAAGGRGLATEALRAILHWADANLNSPRTACIIDPENMPSRTVARKLGYTEVDRLTLKGAPVILHYRDRVTNGV
jgi:RimJ/RimL family protein N-acetyltransferase